ncbi:MAG: FHA domain-containing protein [Planctomycetota bacterium]
MALPPVSDLHDEILSTDAASFASRRPDQDVVILEPHEPGRDYAGDLHGLASYVFLPRAANQPVPVGRDARAVVLLDHAAVSRLHMVMAWTGSAWQFMDRSSNGVFLHDQRVPKEQPTTLGYGTALRLGKALMLRVLTPEGLHRRDQLAGAVALDQPKRLRRRGGARPLLRRPFQVGQRGADTSPSRGEPRPAAARLRAAASAPPPRRAR